MKFSIAPAEKELTLSWPDTPGYTFRLQQSPVLWPAEWSFAPGGDTNPLTVSLEAPARYYRLQEVRELRITRQPQSQTVWPGAHVDFAVQTIGTDPFSYQWQLNGIDLPNATNSILTITNVQTIDDGEYVAVVSDAIATTTSDIARLVVEVPPTIVVQPEPQTVEIGETVTFTVTVTNTATLPIGFNWRKTSQILDSQVLHRYSSSFTLHDVQLSDTGIYSVAVTNAAFFQPGYLSDRVRLTVVE